MAKESSLEKYSGEEQIIRKWYSALHFSEEYDEAFEKILSNPKIMKQDGFTDNGAENLLTALYKCEALEEEYMNLGIDRQILLDTLSDVVIWTDVWYGLTGQLGLMEVGWLMNHFSLRLFRLGRLQFCMNEAEHDFTEYGIRKGMTVMEVHIPSGPDFSLEQCKNSFHVAEPFFERYFPQFRYEYFCCHSWLLDRTLEHFLDKNSKILAFQELFHIIHEEPSDAALKYIFRWDAIREKVAGYKAKTNLAARIKEYVMMVEGLDYD